MPAVTATAPWAIRRVALSSTTDWVVYDLPRWVRKVLVKNPHASAVVYVGDRAETGAFVSNSDHYVTLPAGSALSIELSSTRVGAAYYSIPLASSTASAPVELFLSADAE